MFVKKAIIYIIDSSDKNNEEMSKRELDKLFKNADVKDCVFLVLANKQDLEECMTVEEVINVFDLQEVSGNTWSIYGISTKTGKGIDEAFDWLIDNIEKKTEN